MKSLKMISAALGCAGVLLVTGCGSTEGNRSTGQVIDDTAIHAKVKAALVNDPVVSGTAINVDVERGIVTLDGAVNGVRSVQNNIVIRQ